MTRSLVLALVLVLAACDGPGVVGPGAGRVARIGASDPATALVGNWRRIVFFLDDLNYARSSETTYQFAADGTALRLQVARNHTLGLADVLVAAGRWRVDGTRLVLDFATPSPFQVVLTMRLTGDALDLGGQTFLRVTA